MTSLPVASPRAWTMRSWPWPPSRPRASRPSARSKLVPQPMSSSNPLRGLADHPFDHLAVAQRSAGREGVRDVGFEAVARARARRRCRPGRRRCWTPQRVLGDDHHRQPGIGGQGRPHAGQPAADDQHVGKDVRHPLGVKRSKITRCGGGHEVQIVNRRTANCKLQRQRRRNEGRGEGHQGGRLRLRVTRHYFPSGRRWPARVRE